MLSPSRRVEESIFVPSWPIGTLFEVMIILCPSRYKIHAFPGDALSFFIALSLNIS
jgi:hypothetical protein